MIVENYILRIKYSVIINDTSLIIMASFCQEANPPFRIERNAKRQLTRLCQDVSSNFKTHDTLILVLNVRCILIIARI